jgi:Tol biopolymer transport system component
MKSFLIGFMSVALAASIAGTAGGAAQDAERQLKAAMNTELVDGNLKAAIEQYKKVAQSGNRPLAAQALLRMAECYQKLGDAQARSIYEQLVRDYGDQAEAVAFARTRLSGTRAAARQTGDRVVKSGGDITWGDGRVSADGRLICYTEWNYTGNLMLHDLLSGTDRPLTGNKDWSVGNAYSSTFSPDAKQVAYGWRTYAKRVEGQPQPPHVNEIRIIGIEGPAVPQPRRVYGNADVNYFDPTDWSRDGRWLAVKVTRKDNTGQIAVVGVQDGSFRVLKTIGWRGPKKIFFSPDGKYLAYDLPASDNEAQRDVFVIAADGSGETRAVEHQADDVIMGWSPDGSRLLVASDRTGAVALWALRISNGKPHGAPTLLKPDIGSITSQGVTASGALHFVKNASTKGLHVAPIDLESGRLSGPAVLENFRSGRPDWSADGKLLAYKSTSPNDFQLLSIRSVETGQLRTVPLSLQYMSEPRWLPDGRALVSAGRDLKGQGGIFRIDAQSGRESLVVPQDGNAGRVNVAPDGKKIYYGSARQSGYPAMVEHDLATGEVKETFRRTPGMGVAELSPDGRSFAVVKVDGRAKTSTLLLIPLSGGEARELFRVSLPDSLQSYGGLTWTADSQAVIVVNTTGDRYDPKDLWLVPVSRAKSRKLDVDIRNWGTMPGIRLHPNGKEIAFFVGQDSREVWALENVVPAQITNKQMDRK